MSRLSRGRASTPDYLTGQFDFEAAELSGSSLPKSERVGLEANADLLLEHGAEIKERAIARFGLGVACYPIHSSDAANAKIWGELSRALERHETAGLYAEPLTAPQIEKLAQIHAATKDLIPINSSIMEKIDFFLACLKNGSALDSSNERQKERIVEQSSRFNSGKPAFLSPSEVELLNQYWMRKGELEDGWTQQHEREVLDLLREQQLKLGRSGFSWVDERGFWEPKMQHGRYKNSTLLELIHGKYIEQISDPKYMPQSAQGRKDRVFVIEAANELRSVLKPNSDKSGTDTAPSVESEAKAIKHFLDKLYAKWPPPTK